MWIFGCTGIQVDGFKLELYHCQCKYVNIKKICFSKDIEPNICETKIMGGINMKNKNDLRSERGVKNKYYNKKSYNQIWVEWNMVLKGIFKGGIHGYPFVFLSSIYHNVKPITTDFSIILQFFYTFVPSTSGDLFFVVLSPNS